MTDDEILVVDFKLKSVCSWKGFSREIQPDRTALLPCGEADTPSCVATAPGTQTDRGDDLTAAQEQHDIGLNIIDNGN